MDCLNSLNEVECFKAKVSGIIRISENTETSFKGSLRTLKYSNKNTSILGTLYEMCQSHEIML